MNRSLEDLDRDRFLGEAESLAQLISHPAWPRFDNLLHKMRDAAMEHMAQSTPAEFPYWQGVVAALREIRERPHQIAEAGRAVAEEESHRRETVRTALDLVGRVSLEDDL